MPACSITSDIDSIMLESRQYLREETKDFKWWLSSINDDCLRCFYARSGLCLFLSSGETYLWGANGLVYVLLLGRNKIPDPEDGAQYQNVDYNKDRYDIKNQNTLRI